MINHRITELIYWLQQEILCPEILPYQLRPKHDDGESITNWLKQQQESIHDLKKGIDEGLDKGNRQKDLQYLTLHVIEFERVEYIY